MDALTIPQEKELQTELEQPAKAEHVLKYTKFAESIETPDCEYFLISSHGKYVLNDVQMPTEDSVSFVVPNDTYIIETLDASRLCLAQIDKPLWNLLQISNREKLINLLKTKGALLADSDELKGIVNYSHRVIEPHEYIDTLKNFILYLPGMKLPTRTVLFAKDETKYKYRGFGVYRFPPNSNADKRGAFFPKEKAKIGQALNALNVASTFNNGGELFQQLKATSSTNKVIVNNIIERTPGKPRIILFSSCAEFSVEGGLSRTLLKRNSLMWVMKLQRDAIHGAYHADYRRFLFRKLVNCTFTKPVFLDYVLELGEATDNDNNNGAAAKPNEEMNADEGKYMGMFSPQDFVVHPYTYLLTPIEMNFLHGTAVTKSKDFFEANRQLYITFLEHRAEQWYENLKMFIKNDDPTFEVLTHEYYDSLQGDNPIHANIKENISLGTQMICWTIDLMDKIKRGATYDELKAIMQTYKGHRNTERAAKAAAKAVVAAGKGGARNTHRMTRKNLKRRRQSKRQYR